VRIVATVVTVDVATAFAVCCILDSAADAVGFTVNVTGASTGAGASVGMCFGAVVADGTVADGIVGEGGEGGEDGEAAPEIEPSAPGDMREVDGVAAVVGDACIALTADADSGGEDGDVGTNSNGDGEDERDAGEMTDCARPPSLPPRVADNVVPRGRSFFR
jgi:hypothetical protein